MKILFLGDLMLGENMFHLNRGIITKYKKCYYDLISPHVRNTLLKDCDAIFLNMEYSLIENYNKNLKPIHRVYRGEVSSLDTLPLNKLLIFNIANNHFSQHGIESSQLTKSMLKNKGVFTVGDANDPLIITLGNKLCSFWGFSMINDKNYCKEYNFIQFDDLKNVNKGRNKNSNELWVLSIHWGDEYINYPSSLQRDAVRNLIDNGFDLIIGHHPHVVQPVELYKNGLIVYSLGNFLFDQNFSKETSNGLALLADLTNLSASSFFLTEQFNYKINNYKKICPPELVNLEGNEYNQLIKVRQKIYRNKKRKEFIMNIFRTDYRVLFYLLKKFIIVKLNLK